MSRRMLINAQSREELRIAVLSDSTLENYQVEVAEGGLTRGNIFRGVIANLQPSLNAAFVDYGAPKNGFLAIQDVVPEARYKEPASGARAQIDEILERGRPIVVQVTRDPEGMKGAALTTNLSLAGRYLVFTPFDSTRGVSRKVEDDEDRGQLRDLAARLELPAGSGVIVRTNALGESKAELQRDLAALLRIWKRIQTDAVAGSGARLLYSDQDLILRALRDHLHADVEEVLVDDDLAFEQARVYMETFMPRSKTRLERYTDRVPLFSKFAVESQIERIFGRSVALPSGGSIVIDSTEALTAIDVNSGRGSEGRASHEEMAFDTDMEAASEVARQLRLRDLGGLVVVDFIDLRSTKHKRQVEKAVKDALKADKARTTVGRISPNGLLEINRQKIQKSLPVRAQRPCPTCQGTGRVPSIDALGLGLLRRIQARAASGRLQKARIELHPELAEAIQNGRRQDLAALEQEFGIEIEIVASQRLHGPEEQIEWRDRVVPITLSPRVEEAERRELHPAIVARSQPAERGAESGEESRDDGRRGKRRRRGGRNRGRDRDRETPAATASGDNLILFEGAAAARDDEEPESVEVADGNGQATPGPEGAAGAARGGRRRRRGRRGRRRGKGNGAPGSVAPADGETPAGAAEVAPRESESDPGEPFIVSADS
ncbi:MAG: Rne/Rng family ribonuclease [Thermoanaerobaculia bacterium]